MTHTLPDWAKDAIIVCARATWDAGMLEVVGEDRRLRLAAFRAFQFVQTQDNKPVDANRELYMQWQAAEAEAVRQRERAHAAVEALRNTSSRLEDELDTARRDRDSIERSRNELLDAHAATISSAIAAELHNLRAERDSIAHLLAAERANVRRRDELVARMAQLLAQHLAVGNLTPHYKELSEELLFEVARLDVPQEKS